MDSSVNNLATSISAKATGGIFLVSGSFEMGSYLSSCWTYYEISLTGGNDSGGPASDAFLLYQWVHINIQDCVR